MPTQRCVAVTDGGRRCTGVFVFLLEDRPNGWVTRCPICDTAHRWDASQEEWVVDRDVAPRA